MSNNDFNRDVGEELPRLTTSLLSIDAVVYITNRIRLRRRFGPKSFISENTFVFSLMDFGPKSFISENTFVFSLMDFGPKRRCILTDEGLWSETSSESNSVRNIYYCVNAQ